MVCILLTSNGSPNMSWHSSDRVVTQSHRGIQDTSLQHLLDNETISYNKIFSVKRPIKSLNLSAFIPRGLENLEFSIVVFTVNLDNSSHQMFILDFPYFLTSPSFMGSSFPIRSTYFIFKLVLEFESMIL